MTPARQKLRDEMIAIAIHVVKTEGLSALQARRVAQAAGCAVGTIYNLFDGMDGRVLEANAVTLRRLGKLMQRVRRTFADRPLPGMFKALALAYAGFADRNRLAWKAIFEHRMTGDAPVPGWYRDVQKPLFDILHGLLGGKAEAAVKARAARTLFAGLHGVVALALDEKLAPLSRDELEEEIVRYADIAAAGVKAAIEAGEL